MQPEPAAVFDRTQPDPSSDESHSNTQHGHDLSVDPPRSGLHRETGGPETVHDPAQGGDQSPLNPVTPGLSTPPGDRVSQYENAMGQSSRKQSDFDFQVLPSSAHSDLSLDVFPNGT